jgi:hypothetical protein
MSFSCCKNPITGEKDYLKEFRRAQLHIEKNYINDFMKENNHCKNSIIDFRDFIMQNIEMESWCDVKINMTKVDYHEMLCFLNKYVINEIIYIMKRDMPGEPLSKELQPYNVFKERMFDLFCQKNHDYGNSFVNFGTIGILIRIVDKLNRLITLQTVTEKKVSDESIRDTLEDLYNYTILALIV